MRCASQSESYDLLSKRVSRGVFDRTTSFFLFYIISDVAYNVTRSFRWLVSNFTLYDSECLEAWVLIASSRLAKYLVNDKHGGGYKNLHIFNIYREHPMYEECMYVLVCISMY